MRLLFRGYLPIVSNALFLKIQKIDAFGNERSGAIRAEGVHPAGMP
jgi:hypothetical protein